MSYFLLVGYEFLTHIFNENCVGRTFGMQDIIKQWPVLSLFPMCTTDAGLGIENSLPSIYCEAKEKN